MTLRFLLATLTVTVALLSGCAVALGPGYRVEKQQYEVRWTGGDELAVRGTFRLKNTGTEPIEYIEAVLPEEARRSGLQVWLDQSPVSPEPAAEFAPEGTVRLPFRPAWAKKKKASLVIEYALSGAVADASATPSFYLATQGWYPVLRSKGGLFAFGGEPPKKWDLRVSVPRDFLVHASGKPKGKKRHDELLEHRFRQQRDRDIRPFVIAGKFHEHRGKSGAAEIALWHKDPIPSAKANDAANYVARAVQNLERTLGPLSEKDPGLLLFAEAGTATDPSQYKVATFPRAVWANWSITTHESSRCVVEALAAHWWLAHLSRPEPDAKLLASALADHAPALTAGQCGESAAAANQESLQQTLRGYDQEKQAMESGAKDTGQDKVDFWKLKLFVADLENRVGREKLAAATRRMVQSLRGSTWTTNDLRVAIQMETGEDPAEFFRRWLNQPGIPEEFRKKYEKQASGSR